jgi:hypothetical protein
MRRFVAALILAFPLFAHAEPVADVRFGNAGAVDFAAPAGEYFRQFRVSTLPDRRIAVAMLTYGESPAPRALHLARLLPDGRPDPAFGGGAPTTLGVSPDPDAYPDLAALHLRDDGGQAALVTLWIPPSEGSSSGSFRVLLLAASADGSADPAFNGGVPLHIADVAHSRFRLLALAGGYLVAGFDSNGCCAGPSLATLWRFRADGTPDPQFGNAGVVEIVSNDASVRDVIASPNGRLRVLHTIFNGDTTTSRWQRRRADGSVDDVSGDGGNEPIAGSGILYVDALGDGSYAGLAGSSCVRQVFDANGRAIAGFDGGCVYPPITNNRKAQRYGDGIALSGEYWLGFIPTPFEGYYVRALTRTGAPDNGFGSAGTNTWRPPPPRFGSYDVAWDRGSGFVMAGPNIGGGVRVQRFADDRRGSVGGQPIPALGVPALALLVGGAVLFARSRLAAQARVVSGACRSRE